MDSYCEKLRAYKILLRTPYERQNTIERQGKDLATRGTAIGLVSLSACQHDLLSLTKGDLFMVYYLAHGRSS